jgi:hypothetical protein
LLVQVLGVINRDGAQERQKEHSKMKAFLITANNQVRVFSAEQEAPAGSVVFRSAAELAIATKQ